jgi:hypothetical protein
MAGLAAVEDVDAAAGLRQAPADAEPDDAGADDRDLRPRPDGWINDGRNGGVLSLA